MDMENFEYDLNDSAWNVESDDKNQNNNSSHVNRNGKMEIYDWVQSIITALVLGILIFIFAARVINVDGTSMYPTLWHSDAMITSNLFYTPKQGDIVVVQKKSFGNEPIVKRIIATGGQTVDIDFNEGIVYVDGTALEEDYVNELTIDRQDFTGPVEVPEGYIFLMGDNRNASTDSRDDRIGLVDEGCIIGKVYFIFMPGKNEAGVRDWSRIGSPYK